ncbi:MAG TPA: hypothetical protein VFH06_00475 [Candidatus Saccharimonadales bacterium]|nr:hypothetical protein [Candidatus Saccharimonadales bacterium]
MVEQGTAIRKRQQIAKANRMMFLWVAGVSVVVGISIVASLFLLQKAWFNEKVLAEKGNTAATLTNNNKVIGELKDQVRVLNTNDALRSVMTPADSQPVQVVLDALPSDANSSAFGSSLQEKFLNGSGLTIESLNVDPVQGVESQDTQNVQDASKTSTTENEHQITFRFSVSADVKNASAFKELLRKLERSIRAIDITNLSVETQGNRIILAVNGRAFYEPAKTVELKDKTVKQ